MVKKSLHFFLSFLLVSTSFGNISPLFAQEVLFLSEENAESSEGDLMNEDTTLETTPNDEEFSDISSSDKTPTPSENELPDLLEPSNPPELSAFSPLFLSPFSTFELSAFWTFSLSPSWTLKLTEVYRLGNNERIEITNLSDTDFLGTLTLNGVKASAFTLKNVTIPAYTSVIIADANVAGILDTTTFLHSDAGLNFTDANPINIELLVEGLLIDTFNVDSATIGAHKSDTPRPSFEKLYDNGNRTIQASLPAHNFNIEGFIANPWKLTILGTQTPRIWAGPTPILPSKLVISEVYFDDYVNKKGVLLAPDEERIEIFNLGSGDFYGSFTLSGNIFSGNQISFTYDNLFIPSGGFIILANTGYFFRLPSPQGLLINSASWFPDLDIADDEEIFIELLQNGGVIDTFSVHRDWVIKRDNIQISFQKIILPDKVIITNAMEYIVNIDDDEYAGNPGAIMITDDDDRVDYALPKKPKPIDPTPPDACSEVEPDLLTLTEIFRGTTTYAPYLEFLIHEDMQWDYDFLLLTGPLLQTSLTVDLSDETESYDRDRLEKNTRLILTKQVGSLSDAGLLTILYHPDFELNLLWWELEIYGINGVWNRQSSQLLDIIQTVSATSWKSAYHNWLIRRCWDNMDLVDDFSPGFGQEVLTYFSPASEFITKTVEIVKYVGGWWGCSCPSYDQLCNIPPYEGGQGGSSGDNISLPNNNPSDKPSNTPSNDDQSSEIFWQNPPQSSGEIFWNPSIKILAIEPKSPESITLQSFLPYDVDFTKHTYYLKTSTATTKKYIDGILTSNSIDTFTKNFWFLDAGACVYLYSGDLQLDEICYSTEAKQKEEKISFDPSLYTVKILDILYDPPGADTDNESITLQNLSSHTLDLSNLKLKINTTNKKLTGILNPGETQTLKGTFSFPNSTKDGSEVIVSLFYDTTIFDTYLYNPNTPKVLAQSGEVKVYSVLDGDTFRFRKEDGTLQSVRLLWVDAPESSLTRYRTIECFGKESKTYLTNLLKNQYVRLDYDPTQASVDSYGRLIAYVYLGDTLVNEKILLDGYAKEYTYKTDYQFQSTFQSAQSSAQAKKVWLRSPSTCWVSIEDVPEVRGFDYDKLPLKISSIIYDPDGSDKDNETVVLSLEFSPLLKGGSDEGAGGSNITQPSTRTSPTPPSEGGMWPAGIDFSDNFKLTIFPRSEYSTWTTKNKSLASFWFLPIPSPNAEGEILFSLKGDFQLPNSKATCVSLKYKDYTFDTKCYNPGEEEEIILEGEIASELPSITIRSVLPNPSGKDSEKEEITLMWNYLPYEGGIQGGSEEDDTLNLSPDYYLLINNKTKKKLTGILLPNQEITIKGTFSFPNSASCVTLMKGSDPIDSFCYTKPGEGVRYFSNNSSVQEIPEEELAVVKKITLVRQDDKLCISYNKVLFGCKQIPNSTTEKNAKLLSFQNNYISQLQNHIKDNYSLLYYQSDLKDLFNLYTDVKKEIKGWAYTFSRKGETIPLTDVASTRSIHYQQSAQDYLTSALINHLPPSVLAYYHQEKVKYWESLLKE